VSAKSICVDFRSGEGRAKWAAPVASGRFAFLEMADRRAVRSRRVAVESVPIALDPHRTPSDRLLAAWEPVQARLRELVDELTWKLWLAPLHPHSLVGGVWRVGCRPQCCGWVQARFGRVLLEAAGCGVEIVPCGELA
jgi:hypothetical protein